MHAAMKSRKNTENPYKAQGGTMSVNVTEYQRPLMWLQILLFMQMLKLPLTEL